MASGKAPGTLRCLLMTCLQRPQPDLAGLNHLVSSALYSYKYDYIYIYNIVCVQSRKTYTMSLK